MQGNTSRLCLFMFFKLCALGIRSPYVCVCVCRFNEKKTCLDKTVFISHVSDWCYQSQFTCDHQCNGKFIQILTYNLKVCVETQYNIQNYFFIGVLSPDT